MDNYEENQRQRDVLTDKRLSSIENKVDGVLALANQGQGALWLLLKIGSVIAALAAAAKFVLDLLKHFNGN